MENAVWAIGEIAGGDDASEKISLDKLDETILEEITDVLKRPGQNYRKIIQALGKLGYKAAAERIRPWMEAEDLRVASAAITTLYRFGDDSVAMPRVVEMLCRMPM